MSFKYYIALIIIFCSQQLFSQQAKKFELTSLTFEGNNSFPASTLNENITSQTTPWWFWKFLHSFSSLGKEPVYFDSSNIQLDISSLKDFYNSNGYFEAKFAYKYIIDTSGSKVELIYFVDENKPSYFGKLKLLGLESIPSELLKSKYEDYAVDSTKRFSQSIIQDNTTKVINDLLNSGFMLAKYDSTIVIKDTSRFKTDVNIYFTSGNRYTIDSILINKKGEGASLVDDDDLRDVSGIKVGKLYNLQELRTSQSRLYRTGLFNSAILSPAQKDTTDSKVPIILNATIGSLNELSPEVILNNQLSALNVGLGFSYIRKNFLGDIRKLTLSSSFGVQDIFRLNFGSLIKKFSFRDTTLLGYVDTRLTIDQPYAFEKLIFATWETYATINKQLDYNDNIYGTKVTFDFELPDYTFINHLSSSYTIEQSNELYRVYGDSLARELISDIAADAGSTTADDILFPTQGYNLSFHVEEGNSLHFINAQFYKILLASSYYLSLDKNRSSIVASKFKIGYLQVYSGTFAGVPLNRTFYAGGSNSIRGWLPNELVPVGSQYVRDISGINIVKGGTFLVEGSFELRRKFSDNFGSAVFMDYGNTWLGYNQFRFDGVAVAAGFGFRLYTPVAPIRIDLGLKFYDPSIGQFIWESWNKRFFKNITLHFGLGEAF